MATRSRWLRRGKPVEAEQPTSEGTPNAPENQVPLAPSQAPTAPAGEPTIRKGIYLSALVYVEGDMPAPEDFISPATTALKDALAKAFQGNPGGLSMTVKKVEVQNNVEQDDGNTGTSGKKEATEFQF